MLEAYVLPSNSAGDTCSRGMSKLLLLSEVHTRSRFADEVHSELVSVEEYRCSRVDRKRHGRTAKYAATRIDDYEYFVYV